MIKRKIKKSFYDWCVENNRQDVLDRWDYELNYCSPKDISFSTHDNYWFKCDKYKEHNSELKNIASFTGGHEGSISCKQCNSIAQYILNNFPDKDLYDVWDKEKNDKKGLNPWVLSKGSNKKCWFICQEKDYHGSYEMICNNFTQGQRCCYCKGTKTHKLDSIGQLIIDNYSEEFLWKIWNNLNKISPFDLSPYSRKEIIWNCPDNKHKPFKRSCRASTLCNYRCPNCYEPLKGVNHPNWNPNLTEEERESNKSRTHSREYRLWRKNVFEKDNYTCQACGQKGDKIFLNAHHLDSYDKYEDKRMDINNGITLCTECHKEFHKLYGKGNNTKEQFEEYLNKYFKKEGTQDDN